MSKQDTKTSEFRSTVTFQALLLGTAAFIATTLLSTGDLGTREAIQLRAEEDLKNSIEQVIPDGIYDNDLLESTVTVEGPNGSPMEVYQAMDEGSLTGIAFTVSSFGYSGEISAIMAVDPGGEILGVRILSHSETPGLGDKIEIQKDDWILSFNGRSLGNPPESRWGVKKDGGHFDQFSGATITPRAVVRAVKSGLEFYQERKSDLSSASPEPAPQTNAEPPDADSSNETHHQTIEAEAQ